MSQNLPVIEILLESLRRPVAKYRELVRLCWPYAAVFILEPFLPVDTSNFGMSISYVLLLLIFSVLAAIGCHRIFLLSEEDVIDLSAVRWGQREMQFLLKLIGIGIMTSLISFPLMLVLTEIQVLKPPDQEGYGVPFLLLTTLIWAPVYYFVARWSLILPDSALDVGRKTSWAWSASKGNSFRLFLLVGLIPLLNGFLWGLIQEALGSSLIIGVLQNVVWVVVWVIEICLLSLSYEWIVLEKEKDGLA